MPPAASIACAVAINVLAWTITALFFIFIVLKTASRPEVADEVAIE